MQAKSKKNRTRTLSPLLLLLLLAVWLPAAVGRKRRYGRLATGFADAAAWRKLLHIVPEYRGSPTATARGKLAGESHAVVATRLFRYCVTVPRCLCVSCRVSILVASLSWNMFFDGQRGSH